jgi:hypothetical protein
VLNEYFPWRRTSATRNNWGCLYEKRKMNTEPWPPL